MRKTEEERKEDEEIAAAVNRTLAEEEKKKKEEEDEKKKSLEKKTKEDVKTSRGQEDGGEDEASPTFNSSCPVSPPCLPCPETPTCPPCKRCPVFEPCPDIEPCPECKECPKRECGSCPPCEPCPVVNTTCGHQERPSSTSCPNTTEIMSFPVALAVGAILGALITGVASGIGLLLRYASPLECGFAFLATIVIVWYFSSQYPETARELGGRAMDILREASVALGHRIMAAVQRHQDQVGLLTKPNLFLSLSSSFHLKGLH